MSLARAAAALPLVLVAVLLSSCIPSSRCEDAAAGGDGGGLDQATSAYLTSLFYDRLTVSTTRFTDELRHQLGFCIKDADKDWNTAFNFSSDLQFLTDCINRTNGDVTHRICTAAEIKFYFTIFHSNLGQKGFLQPNKNCNLTFWVSGCEPGWACTVDQSEDFSLHDSQNMPERTLACRPCCAGFFCPRGLTCMIPCPLGSYCPLAKLNQTTGACDPYGYQLPPGNPNHTCGSADIWTDVGRSSEMFCAAGYYCPSTIQRLNCSSGHYCRMGSTSQKRCLKQSSCEPNSSNQNITFFGALLMVAMALLLLIIYNFSGQFLTSRERKQSIARENAARMANESSAAREKWKAAKDTAMKQLSRTFSRRKSVKRLDLNFSGEYEKENNDVRNDTVTDAQQSSAASTRKIEKSNNHSVGEDQDCEKSFSSEIDALNMPKAEKLRSQAQIFKYAYDQLEREKVLQYQSNVTFSGVISIAHGNVMKTRPTIEVYFKDLTLKLKQTKRPILRCVTGKLMPGHVTAVMGPSGAGKTTFLSALSGKSYGCDMSGLIFINGNVVPIHAYKKVIGFVPQDDIIHGNLTVQENLWFNARCRLSADMPKAEKVLVVERVIESLGLQAVRNSFVGTVEKRGISGGQRKRVNVGIEMVMEPSLLLLDEPTSGLDSSSSQLLLRALRREALEGVNVCLVVHQPSYALFKMFDDLILLAKGGLTVYHGPIEKVEEYFTGLGINVPDRVNPPDYYIDILEGIVKPATAGVTSKKLPLKWMHHNGYEISPDMFPDASEFEIFARNVDARLFNDISKEQSLTSGVDKNGTNIIEHSEDSFGSFPLNGKPIPKRRTPGILRQYKYFLGRVVKQRLREARIQGVDYLILCLAGVCLGIFAKISDHNFGAVGYSYTVIAVSLLCKIGALRSFSLDKLQYWRERASGISSLAYFMSKDTIDHFNTLVKPLVYLSMFYFFSNPRSSMLENYIVLVALVYCVTGIGYMFAICFQTGSAQLWSALVPVVLTLVATQRSTSKILADLCYTKWALEAFVIANAQRHSGVWLITRCGALMLSRYDIHEWGLCIAILFLYGLAFRFLAFICLLTLQKKK